MSEELKNESESKNIAAPVAKNNTIKYIVIGLIVLAVVGYGAKYVMGMFVMGAVNAKLESEGMHVSGNPMQGGSYTITGKDGETVKVDTNSVNGTYNATDNKGNTVSVGAGTKLPDNFPTSAPIYADAIIQTSATSQDGGKSAYTVSMTTKDPYETVANYYKKALTENGWKTLQSLNMSAQYTMYSAENKSLELSVMVQGDEKGGNTTIMLTTSDK